MSEVILDTTDALDALEILREAEMPMGLIHDEYGHFEGIVTPADILQTIAGVFRSDREDAEPQATPRDDGSWLLAGSMPADEMADQLGITLPAKREYHTVAGFVLAHLRHLPATGEATEVSGWRFEVVDLDGRRIDKVLAIRLPVSRRMLRGLDGNRHSDERCHNVRYLCDLAGAGSFIKQGGTQPGGLGIPQPFPNYPIPLLPHFG